MTTPSSLNVLRQSDQGGELVVACDFSAGGRPIATFTDLAGLLRGNHTIWETTPAPYGQEADTSAASQIEYWSRDIRSSGVPVRAVLGFCSGCVYAGALAERISQWQQRPRLILLDPEPADARMMIDFYENLVTRRFAAMLSSAEIADAVQAGHDAAESLGLMALAHRLGELCRQVVEPACEGIGLTSERIAEFLGLSLSYLYWLAVAGPLDVRSQWSAAEAINCANPDVGLRGFEPIERAGLVARAVYLDVSHTDLMRCPETARIVDELLS
jgi:hypothetical protein